MSKEGPHGPNADESAHTATRILIEIEEASLTAADLRALARSCWGFAAELDDELGTSDAPAEIGLEVALAAIFSVEELLEPAQLVALAKAAEFIAAHQARVADLFLKQLIARSVDPVADEGVHSLSDVEREIGAENGASALRYLEARVDALRRYDSGEAGAIFDGLSMTGLA